MIPEEARLINQAKILTLEAQRAQSLGNQLLAKASRLRAEALSHQQAAWNMAKERQTLRLPSRRVPSIPSRPEGIESHKKKDRVPPQLISKIKEALL